MFRYTCHDGIRPDGMKGEMDIRVGDVVQSMYRAHWTGEVVGLISHDQDKSFPRMNVGGHGGCAIVMMTHTRRGQPVRKPKLYVYSCLWFKVISRPAEFPRICWNKTVD